MSISILKIRDKNGKWIPIEAIRGEDGADGADGLTPYIKYGTWWIGDIDTGVKAEAQESAVMATGEYVGTGTGNVSLHFAFEPKLLIMLPFMGIFTKNTSIGFYTSQNTGLDDPWVRVDEGVSATFSDNSVSINGLNTAGTTYRYVAIGNGNFLDGDEVEY